MRANACVFLRIAEPKSKKSPWGRLGRGRLSADGPLLPSVEDVVEARSNSRSGFQTEVVRGFASFRPPLPCRTSHALASPCGTAPALLPFAGRCLCPRASDIDRSAWPAPDSRCPGESSLRTAVRPADLQVGSRFGATHGGRASVASRK